jgi:uncharacterized protein YlxW (UPF0749 family)
MSDRKWLVGLSLSAIFMVLGLLLVAQLPSQSSVQDAAGRDDWEFVVADLVDSNARLREEVESLQRQVAQLQGAEGGGTILESLVDEVNHLRITNGLVEVSGPGVEVVISGPLTVLDLHDLINELRNSGAEALALNGRRLVVWSAISTDGEHVTVDGQPVEEPYLLGAIGDARALEVALNRPGGLVALLEEAEEGLSVAVQRQNKLTLPVYDQPFVFVHARAVQ